MKNKIYLLMFIRTVYNEERAQKKSKEITTQKM